VNCAHEEIAVRGAKIAAAVLDEGAVAGDVIIPAGRLDDEEAIAVDSHVGGDVRGLENTLAEIGRRAGHLRAEADAEADRIIYRGGAGLLDERLVKVGRASLERRGVRIGNVVADDVHFALVCQHAADA
jgi:hypothetical protein